MAIVTELYYTTTYIGESVLTADFPRFEARAEEAVLLFLHGRVDATNFTDQTATNQTLIQKAICAQIEYLAYLGIRTANFGNANESFTVGKVSVNSSKLPVGKTSIICPAAMAFLEQTGLAGSQVDCPEVGNFPMWR